jgi:hypothetical protein
MESASIPKQTKAALALRSELFPKDHAHHDTHVHAKHENLEFPILRPEATAPTAIMCRPMHVIVFIFFTSATLVHGLFACNHKLDVSRL